MRREPTFLALRELEESQWRPRTQILERQQELLRGLLRHAASFSPFYRDRIASGDLRSIPLLTKDELRANAHSILAMDAVRRVELCKTSGSTGEPLKFYRDRKVFAYTLASVYRAHRWHGIDVGAREAMLWGIPGEPLAKLRMRVRDAFLNRFREAEYSLDATVLDAFYRRCLKSRPEYIFGYSSMVFEFALFLRSRSLDVRSLGLKAAICTAESIEQSQRDLIESQLGCQVVSEYGAAETGIISYECPEGSHHISEDTVLLEILDDQGNEAVPGELGRVVVTVLRSHAAPIIRYRLGDLAVRGSGTCRCGRSLAMLDRVIGRESGVIVTPSGKCFHSIVLYYVMKDFAAAGATSIRQFKAIQTAVNHLEVHLVLQSPDAQDAETRLTALLKARLGGEMQFSFVRKSSIERSPSGKLRDFESRVDAAAHLANAFQRLDA